MAEILVVDDEIGIRELLSEILGDEGHSVLLADSDQQARDVRDRTPIWYNPRFWLYGAV